MKIKLLLLIFILVASSGYGQKKKKSAQLVIPMVNVVDKPIVDWISYPTDTTTVGLNIQTLTCQIKSKLPLQRIEIMVNGLSTDVYTNSDLSPAAGQNNYMQLIERTVTLRTGSNIIEVIAENTKGIRNESIRRVVVDPSKIAMVRNKNDQTPPMVYLSNPSNIRNDQVIVYTSTIDCRLLEYELYGGSKREPKISS